jgi:hypothetical protein
VTATPRYTTRETDLNVSSELVVKTKGYKLQLALKTLISFFRFDTKNAVKDPIFKYSLNVLYSKHTYMQDLGMIKIEKSQRDVLDLVISQVNHMKENLEWNDQTIFWPLEKCSLVFVNPEEYYGQLGTKPLDLVLTYQDREKKNHPVKHVGVGYDDKGNAKNSSHDGSPAWQEIAVKSKENITLEFEQGTTLFKYVKIVKISNSYFQYQIETDCHWNREILTFQEISLEGKVGWKLLRCDYYQKFFLEKLYNLIKLHPKLRKLNRMFVDPSDGSWCFTQR